MPNKLITVVKNAIFFSQLCDATFLPRGKNSQVCGWMIFFVLRNLKRLGHLVAFRGK